MKTDLITAIGAAVAGLIIAFFITNLFIGEIQPFTYKTLDSSVNVDLVDPDPEVFNYKALNPTVEVYVGSCMEYDTNGECVETVVEEDQAGSESNSNQESSNQGNS